MDFEIPLVELPDRLDDSMMLLFSGFSVYNTTLTLILPSQRTLTPCELLRTTYTYHSLEWIIRAGIQGKYAIRFRLVPQVVIPYRSRRQLLSTLFADYRFLDQEM